MALPRDPLGFTYAPLHPSARNVFVDPLNGKDTNDGLSQDRPLQTLKKAVPVLRDNFGDHLLLKRGSPFTERLPNISASGLSPDFPTVVAGYGDGPRPFIEITDPSQPAFGIDGRAVKSDIAFIGLEFYCSVRDPNNPKFSPALLSMDAITARFIALSGAKGSVKNILVEDCRFSFFRMGPEFDGVVGMTFRRNIVTDLYGSKSQGLYTYQCGTPLVEDNFFDMIGWSAHPKLASLYPRNELNHAIYIQSDNEPHIVRNNWFCRPSSHGCQNRPGGNLDGNVFFECPCGGFVAITPSTIQNKLVIAGEDISPQKQRGWGLQSNGCPQVVVSGNLVINKKPGVGTAWAYEFVKPTTPPIDTNIAWVGNYSANWRDDVVSNPQNMASASTLKPDTSAYDPSIVFDPTLLTGHRTRPEGTWSSAYATGTLYIKHKALIPPPKPTKDQVQKQYQVVTTEMAKLQDLINRM